MKKVKALFLLVFLLSINISFSQEIEFYAKSNKSMIGEDEKIIVEFTINKETRKFIPPIFKDFKVLQGPSHSSSVYTKIINGKYSSEKKVTYSFVLMPKKKGTLKIENATAYVNGKYYKSKPLTIKVFEEKDLPKDINSPLYKAKSNIHIGITFSKKNPYIGEQIIVTYKLYFNVNISSPRAISQPNFSGFLASEIKLDERRGTKRGNYKGRNFNEFLLKKVILTPNKSGKLKLGSYKLDVPVEIPTGRYDWFGSAITKTENITVKSPIKYINVKPLPKGQPDNFKGAIGNFNIRVSIDKNSLKANESIQLKTTISGNGNINTIKIPDISIPTELEIYDPKESRNIKNTDNGTKGSIEKEYLIIPRNKGIYKIPSINFSYFDIKNKKFKNLKTKEITINVSEGDEVIKIGEGRGGYNTTEKSRVEYLNSDISYIKLDTELEKINTSSIFSIKSKWFYLFFFLPFFGIFILIFLDKKKERQAKDIDGTKKKKASKIIKKRLKVSKEKLNQNKSKEFFEEIETALYSFISDKFSIPKSGLYKENILEILKNNNINDKIIEELIYLLDKCEIAKYSPSFDASKENDIFEKTKNIIMKIN